jgi:hypothetical protein
MSDGEYETTDIPEKPVKEKKERTPAQKAATARALEALAAAREAKKAEKATVVKRTTTTTKVMPRPKASRPPPQAIEEPTEEDHPYLSKPSRAFSKPVAKPTRDYGEDLEDLRAGLRNVVEYVETKKAKKATKKPVPVEESSSSSSSEEEPPVVRKKNKKPMKAPDAPSNQKYNTIDPQDTLRSLFWRNM